MSDTDTPPVEGTTPDPASAGDGTEGPAGLRAHVAKLEAELTLYKGQVLSSHLESIGLKPDQGLGKAIAKEFQLTGEVTAETVAAYAKSEYGYEQSAQPTPPPPEVVAAEKIGQVIGQSAPLTPPAPVDPAAEITAKMHDPNAGREDAEKAITAKVVQFAQEHYGVQGQPVQPGQPGQPTQP